MYQTNLRHFLAASAASAGFCALAFVPSVSTAALVTFTSEAAFTGARPGLSSESFESNAGQVLATSTTVSTPGFSVSTVGTATLGVQTGANAPNTGNGAFATDGTHYLLSYLPNQPTGTLRFDFASVSNSFGLTFTDVGEAAGVITISTNAGDTAGGITAYTFGPTLPNGSALFFGFSQTAAFSQVFITVTGVDESYGLDKVYFGAQGNRVPEPGSLGLMLLGLAGVAGGVARQNRRRSLG